MITWIIISILALQSVSADEADERQRFLIPLFNHDSYQLTMMAQMAVTYNNSTVGGIEKNQGQGTLMIQRGKFLLIPNSCLSIHFATTNFFQSFQNTHSQYLDFQFHNDDQAGQMLHGQWHEMNITHNSHDIKNVSEELAGVNQYLHFPLKFFVTNERPRGYEDLGIDGIIGMSPCPPQPKVNASTDQSAFYDFSFFLKLKEKLNGITDIKWDINYGNNDGTAHGVGNGWLKFNFDNSGFEQREKLNSNSLQLYDLNDIFQMGPDKNPKSEVDYSYNFECGPTIGQTKFKDGIDLYSGDTAAGLSELHFNMLPRLMQVDGYLVNYVHDQFMIQCTDSHQQASIINTQMWQCPSSIMSGFPSILMTLENGKIFQFDANDFFVFPTVKNDTAVSEAFFGLIQYSQMSESVKLRMLENFQFGQLFVQKYGLQIELNEVKDSGYYTADIYSRVDTSDDSIPWGNIIVWIILLIIGVLFLYSIYLKKKYRLRNEDAATTRLLEELMEKELDVKDENFEDLRYEMIHNIHESMLKVINQDELNKKLNFKKSGTQLHIE